MANKKAGKTVKAITGTASAAEAMRQINPDVVGAFPITPQTAIMQKFSEFVADGIVDTELVRVESEHSAMSVCVGASAAGARAMTATASAGLALMWEIVGVASGSRLPIIMNVVNRALSSPINIHCDHSDSMGARDHGWVQIYSENNQEVYENTLLAVRIGEHPDVMLPVMVCQDGFITSHGVVNTTIFDDNVVKKFVGEHKPEKWLLNVKDPVTMGPLELQDYYFETKRQQIPAMEKAKEIFLAAGKELSKITGNKYEFIEKYNLDDADAVIITMNSTAGTTKTVIDKMREEGKKVGLLKIRLFRPFCYKEVGEALKNAKAIAVLDRSESFGANAPIFGEIKNTLYDLNLRPKLQSCVFGLGGRNIFESDIEAVFDDLLAGNVSSDVRYIGVRE
ncbi:pyruvate ferredoxin oxidoreductase [Candidatus Woesearchaeota archaeon]|nr:pyruvate ferredoxin oxidoreductase [Candidatus Woesearchaeota archaeon]